MVFLITLKRLVIQQLCSWQDELSTSSDGNPNIIGEQDYIFSIPLIDVTINPVTSNEDDDNIYSNCVKCNQYFF